MLNFFSKRLIILFGSTLFFVLLLFLVYFFVFKEDKNPALLDVDEQVYVVSRQDLSKNVSVSGNLTFANVKTLKSPIDGEIDQILFDFPYPSIVQEGDILARLTDLDFIRLESQISQLEIELELANQLLNEFLLTDQGERLATAYSEVFEKENQLIAARDDLFSGMNDADERANALSQIHVAEKELINSNHLLDDLLSPYPSRLTELIQVKIAARQKKDDFETTVNDLNDPLGSPQYLELMSELTTLKNSLEIAEKNQNLNSLTKNESIEGSAKDLESKEIAYIAILEKWFGVDEQKYLKMSPGEIYQFWEVDLKLLFDKKIRKNDVEAFLNDPIVDSITPWDDNVVLTWLAMYPVTVVGACDESSSATLGSASEPLPNIICVDYEIQSTWDELEDARLKFQQTELEAHSSFENNAEIVRTALEKIDLKEEVIADYLDSEKLRIQDAKEQFNIAISEHEFAEKNIETWHDSIELELAIQEADVVLKETALEMAHRNFENLFVDPSDIEISLLKSKLDFADAEFSNSLAKLELAKHPDDFQQTFLENDIQRLEISIADIQQKIEEAVIRSPFDGVILQYFVNQGERVSQGLGVVEVAELNMLNFEGSVGEAEVNLVENGMKVELVLDSIKGSLIKGQVKNVSMKSVVEQGVVTYPVVVSLDNFDGIVLSEGLSGVSELLIEKSVGQIVIPMSAVKENDQGKFVNVKQDDVVVQRPVKLGINDNFWVAVLEGLDENESIVIKSSKGSTEKFELDFGDDEEDNSNRRRGPGGRRDN